MFPVVYIDNFVQPLADWALRGVMQVSTGILRLPPSLLPQKGYSPEDYGLGQALPSEPFLSYCLYPTRLPNRPFIIRNHYCVVSCPMLRVPKLASLSSLRVVLSCCQWYADTCHVSWFSGIVNPLSLSFTVIVHSRASYFVYLAIVLLTQLDLSNALFNG